MREPNVTLSRFAMPVDYAELRRAVDWAERWVRVYGKNHPQPRLTRWYGEVPYTYSGLTWDADPMPPLLASIRTEVEFQTGERFNSVLCNLYRGGQDCIGWHADDEPIFGGDPVVASLSFGAARVFKLRRSGPHHRDVPPVVRAWRLDPGSLLVMGRGVQTEWEHSVPRTREPVGERINLTFRRTVA